MNKGVRTILVIGLLAAIVLIAGVVSWRLRPQSFDIVTDGDSIELAADDVAPRDVLWRPADRLPSTVNSTEDESQPAMTPDGLSLYFVRGRPGANTDLYVAQRNAGGTGPSSLTTGWSDAEPVPFNSPADELAPAFGIDGRLLIFASNRAGGHGGYDLWAVECTPDGWGEPYNLGPNVNSAFHEYGAAPDPRGGLYFASNRDPDADPRERRDTAEHDFDMYYAGPGDSGWEPAEPVTAVNTDHQETTPCLGPNGRLLYFASDRPDGFGAFDLYRSMVRDLAVEPPANLGPTINTAADEMDPALALAGFAVYFGSARDDGAYDLYVAVSSEVYTDTRVERAQLDWGELMALLAPLLFWLILGLLLLLACWVFFVDGRWRRINLIAQCLLGSLILHCLLLLLFTFWGVASPIMDYVRHRSGTKIVMVSGARTNDIAGQLRGGLSDPNLDDIVDPVQQTALAEPTVDSPQTVELPPSDTVTDRAVDTGSLARAESRDAESPLTPAPEPTDSPPEETTVAVEIPATGAPSRRAEVSEAPGESARPREVTRTEAAVAEADDSAQRIELEMNPARPERSDTRLAQANPDDASAPDAIEQSPRPEVEVASNTPAPDLPRAESSRAERTAEAESRLTDRVDPSAEPAEASVPDAAATDATAEVPARTVEMIQEPNLASVDVDDARMPRTEVATSASTEPTEALEVDVTGAPLETVARSAASEAVPAPSRTDPGAQQADPDQAGMTGQTASTTIVATTPTPDSDAVPSAPLAVVTSEDADSVPTPVRVASQAAEPGQSDVTMRTPDTVDLDRSDDREAAAFELPVAEGIETARSEVTNPSTTGDERVDVSLDAAPADAEVYAPALSAPDLNLIEPETSGHEVAGSDAVAAAVATRALTVETSNPREGGRDHAAESTGDTSAVALAVTDSAPARIDPPSLVPSSTSALPEESGAPIPTHQSTLAGGSTADAAAPDVASPVSVALPPTSAFADAAIPSDTDQAAPTGSREARMELLADTGQSTGLRLAPDAETPEPTSASFDTASSAETIAAERFGDDGPADTRPTDAALPSLELRTDAAGQPAPRSVALPALETAPPTSPDERVAEMAAAPSRSVMRADPTRPAVVPSEPTLADAPPVQLEMPVDNRLDPSIASAPIETSLPIATGVAVVPNPITDIDRAIDLPTLRLPEEMEQPIVATPYKQRSPDRRQELVEELGGNRETERAVNMALRWLAGQQMSNGRWSSRELGDTSIKSDVAITGLSILCFLAADHTHLNDSDYSSNVKRAIDWLLTQQDPRSGSVMRDESMYSHGIASLALSEAYGMTGDERLREPVEAMLSFTYLARNTGVGGWRYGPGQVGDTAVTGWQMMAMMSARRAGFDVDQRSIDAVGEWLDLVSTPRRPGRYSYRPGEAPTPSMTAEAMYCRQLLGVPRNDLRMRESARVILTNPPEWRKDANTYYWYYATLATFNHQGEAWDKWNAWIQAELVDNQRTSGPMQGSWDPNGRWASIGGRVYQTALACLTLEVYYRYLPLYGFGQ